MDPTSTTLGYDVFIAEPIPDAYMAVPPRTRGARPFGAQGCV